MIDYLIGVDGGGTGTRVRIARAGGQEFAQGEDLSAGVAQPGPGAGAAAVDADEVAQGHG